jgi:hypothetical protein
MTDAETIAALRAALEQKEAPIPVRHSNQSDGVIERVEAHVAEREKAEYAYSAIPNNDLRALIRLARAGGARSFVHNTSLDTYVLGDADEDAL